MKQKINQPNGLKGHEIGTPDNGSSFSTHVTRKQVAPLDPTKHNDNSYQSEINQRCKLPTNLDGSKIYLDQIKELNQKIKILNTITAIISVIIIVLTFVEVQLCLHNEIFWKNDNQSEGTCDALRSIIAIAAVICVVVHWNYKVCVIEYRDNRVDEDVSLFSTGLLSILFAEVFINAVICPPKIDITYSMWSLGQENLYSSDAMVAVWSLLRLYTVVRLFEHYSHWTNKISRRVWQVPQPILNVLVQQGFALRTFEVGLSDSSFQYTWNSFWVVILTMTTIGYGDIYPRTHLGKITCIIACIWGVFILSLIVVALTNTTEFTQKEEQVYDAIIKDKAVQNKLKKEAGILVKEFLLLTFSSKKNGQQKTNQALDKRSRQVQQVQDQKNVTTLQAQYLLTLLRNVMQQEEDNEELLTAMQYQIDDSLRELKFGLEQMKLLYDNSKKAKEEQKEFEVHARSSHKLSVCLCNLASLLTEFGPVKPIRSMKEIESKQVLSAEQLKENIFRASFTSQDPKRSSSNIKNPAIQEEQESEEEEKSSSDSSSFSSQMSPETLRSQRLPKPIT